MVYYNAEMIPLAEIIGHKKPAAQTLNATLASAKRDAERILAEKRPAQIKLLSSRTQTNANSLWKEKQHIQNFSLNKLRRKILRI